jgi:hypothetical protein
MPVLNLETQELLADQINSALEHLDQLVRGNGPAQVLLFDTAKKFNEYITNNRILNSNSKENVSL